jgi:hypothetical protein
VGHDHKEPPCYRHYRGDELPSYSNIRPKIIGKDGRELTLIHLDETSLYRDDPQKHGSLFDLEEWKRRADESRFG